MQRSWYRGTGFLLGAFIMASMIGCGPGITHTVRLGVEHSERARQIGDTVNTAANNGYEVGGSVELSFEDSGLSMLEVCGTGEYWFGGYDYSDNPSRSVATKVPMVSLCTEVDMEGDQDDDQPRTESRMVQ